MDKSKQKLINILEYTKIELDKYYDYGNNRSVDISKPERKSIKESIEEYFNTL